MAARNTGAATTFVGRTHIAHPISTPATAALRSEISGNANSATAAPIHSAAVSGSEKSHAEYTNRGEPTAITNASVNPCRSVSPIASANGNTSAAASAANVALLHVDVIETTRSCAPAGTPGSFASTK